ASSRHTRTAVVGVLPSRRGGLARAGSPSPRPSPSRAAGAACRGRLAASLVVAAGVYLSTYLPWLLAGHDLGELVQLHREMLAFHTAMPAEAPQSQPSYLWPCTLRAVTFLVETSHDEVRAVLCTGGRVLWWGIVPALAFGAWRARRRSLRCLVPVLAIVATW